LRLQNSKKFDAYDDRRTQRKSLGHYLIKQPQTLRYENERISPSRVVQGGETSYISPVRAINGDDSLRANIGKYYNIKKGISPARHVRLSQRSIKAKSMRNINGISAIGNTIAETPTGRQLGSVQPNFEILTSGVSQTYNPIEYAKEANLTYVGSTQNKN
jgi:hypothetical protein